MSKIGYVYRIIDNTNGNQYYGSTTQAVAQRMTKHRSMFKNGKLECSSVEILKNGNWRYETLEKVLFDEKFELRNIERRYIENNECVNKCIPNRTGREYNIDNADEIKQYKKQYRIDNVDEIKQYRTDNAGKMKQYRIDNADKMKQYNKQYQIDNADKQRAKTTCECGGKYTHGHKSHHMKSKKHLLFTQKTQEVLEKAE